MSLPYYFIDKLKYKEGLPLCEYCGEEAFRVIIMPNLEHIIMCWECKENEADQE